MAFIDDLTTVARQLCGLREEGDFVPLLEADITGCLFYLLLKDGHCSLKEIHLDTRVSGVESNAKFDIAIGPIELIWHEKPAIKPRAVIELKAFPSGFTDQQHRVHFEHVLNDDLRKLGDLPSGVERIQCIYDEVDYLSGRYGGEVRHSVVLSRRDEIASGISLVLLRKANEEWQVSME